MVDLVVVGVTKCGSTYIDSILRHNPSFSLPRGIKETNFFSVEYQRGISWYLGLFNTSKILVEVCPNYSRDVNSLKRIKDLFPKARILLLLRDPKKRFVSHCKHFFRTRNVAASYAQIVELFPEIILDSDYEKIFDNCLQVFGETGFDVLRFEDFISDFAVIESYFFTHFNIKLARPDYIELNEYYDTRFKRIYSFLRYLNRFFALRGFNFRSLFGDYLIKLMFESSSRSRQLVDDLPEALDLFLDRQSEFFDNLER